MGSSFGSITTAYSALVAQRRALEVAGQNIANANTEGYTRQRVNMEEVGAPSTAATWSKYDGAGQGVRVVSTERMLDQIAQQRQLVEHAKDQSLQQQASTLTGIENQLIEPSDNGIKSQLEKVWNDFENVSNHAGEGSPRDTLLADSATLAGSLRSARGALDDQWQNTRGALVQTIDQVNTAAASVAQLNGAIRKDVLAGLNPNELSDQRDKLVQKIADLTGATSRVNADGTTDVYIAGSSLVRGDNADKLVVSGTTDPSLATGSNPVTVLRQSDGNPAGISSGAAAGQLISLSSTIPAYAAKLDAFAGQLATAVNNQHKLGYDLNGAGGGAPPTGTGTNFFGSSDGNPITAKNITVAITDPRAIAASSNASPAGNTGGGNASLMAAIADDPTGPESTYANLVVSLGNAAHTADAQVNMQQSVVKQVDASAASVSGVDMDEEMANMLQYQRAYEAAARVLTTIDSTLDILINRTGLVGR